VPVWKRTMKRLAIAWSEVGRGLGQSNQYTL
jgi:hypothetical protein